MTILPYLQYWLGEMADVLFQGKSCWNIGSHCTRTYYVYTCVHEQQWMLRQMYSLVPWFYQSHCVNTQVGIPGNGALPHG